MVGVGGEVVQNLLLGLLYYRLGWQVVRLAGVGAQARGRLLQQHKVQHMDLLLVDTVAVNKAEVVGLVVQESQLATAVMQFLIHCGLMELTAILRAGGAVFYLQELAIGVVVSLMDNILGMVVVEGVYNKKVLPIMQIALFQAIIHTLQ